MPMTLDQLKPHKSIRGPLFTEPVEVLVTIPMGNTDGGVSKQKTEEAKSVLPEPRMNNDLTST